MSENQASQTNQPTAEFIQQTQHILNHLHDFPYLLNHPISRVLDGTDHQKIGEELALRKVLMQAIESLSPSHVVSFRAPHVRLYSLLQLHYVEGMTITEVAQELNISVRQAYRDLRHAEESVASLLWMHYQSKGGSHELNGGDLHVSQDQSQRGQAQETSVDVRQLVTHALQAVLRMAQSRAVTCSVDMPEYPVIVFTDEVVAQQLIVSSISRAVQHVEQSDLHVRLMSGNIGAQLTLRYRKASVSQQSGLNSAVLDLGEQLGWPPVITSEAEGITEVCLDIPARGVILLVIDDNAGLADLFERYLEKRAFHIMRANTAESGLSMARQIHPDAIILDIMLPIVDGWQILQALQNDRDTDAIPVVMCSVISDPELAYSLGAAHVLSKPVSRDALLTILDSLNLT